MDYLTKVVCETAVRQTSDLHQTDRPEQAVCLGWAAIPTSLPVRRPLGNCKGHVFSTRHFCKGPKPFVTFCLLHDSLQCQSMLDIDAIIMGCIKGATDPESCK